MVVEDWPHPSSRAGGHCCPVEAGVVLAGVPQITGNRRTVKLVGSGARDPAFVVAWEAAPFYRPG